jgi:hypothetical protein
MVECDLQTLLAKTMRDVLETSFFAEILEEGSTEMLLCTCPVIAASMTFSGAASGSFLLTAETLAAHRLAMEFMGDPDEEIDDGIAGCSAEMCSLSLADEEVFKELTNVLCGSVLSRFQADRCCNLSQPVLCPGEITSMWIKSSASQCVYSAVRLESGVVAGYWRLDVVR